MLDSLGHHRLTVEQAIPAHAGLGSGTQIALAVAAALRTLHGLPLDIEGDAVRMARGRRSGVGIASFGGGGVIVDAGKDDSAARRPLSHGYPFREEWRVILVFDTVGTGCMAMPRSRRSAHCRPFPRQSWAKFAVWC